MNQTGERRRLAALAGYRVMDTPAEPDFDDIVTLAAQVCGTPMAMISLVDADRQWFKARIGTDVTETPRSSSLCALAMYADGVTHVPDARLDPRFARSPLVTGAPGIRLYAGAPLADPEGRPLGTLCVADHEPRELTEAQQNGLRALSRHVVSQLELRRYARDMRELNERLRDAERIKDEFLSRVTHELRTPLSSIHGYLEVLDDPDLSSTARAGFLERIQRNSDRLITLVDDMLLAARLSGEHGGFDRHPADLALLVTAVATQNRPLAEAKGLTVTAEAEQTGLFAGVDLTRLTQALDRLVLNAVKFTAHGGIRITAGRRGDRVEVRVADTGIGIGRADRERVLQPFRRAAEAEKAEVPGVGLGLTIVKAIVEGHDGALRVESLSGQGTTIVVELPAL
ncbi:MULTISPECIES: GAF domain-containing sensor histidine kinase [Actinoplanes]|uniref:GAF domain-containing sensor histidine kinase n=1 Tax=Actinoplanes TaxID=1865 RepID=UPI0005F2A738|nr:MULTISPECIES: GAF domain-containing sensor histidine kinase [Actinoplanes]GLY07338.1 sensor histidine kinase [Actinoplanes sp. NBRC 101535]